MVKQALISRQASSLGDQYELRYTYNCERHIGFLFRSIMLLHFSNIFLFFHVYLIFNLFILVYVVCIYVDFVLYFKYNNGQTKF